MERKLRTADDRINDKHEWFLRIAEVVEMDLQIDDGEVAAYRTKIKVSFKYEE